MSEHQKKKVAPVVVTVLVVLYYALYFGLLFALLPGLWWKLLLGVIPLGLGAAMLAVCIQRLKEIDGGEEDDLSQY